MEDRKILNHIKQLIDDEQDLYTKGNLSSQEMRKLHKMQVELDEYWDLLRQRRALRDAGENPDKAKLRPPKIVENYKQ